jgi:cyclase
MLKKRLVGVITVKDGWAVQSFAYRRHLPLGRPEVLTQNLDRWGVDEIVLMCIDRHGLGPDLKLLKRIGGMGLSTPLIYGGGIATLEQGIAAVQSAADRICLDGMLHDSPDTVVELAEHLGAQALIAAMPLSAGPDGLRWLDHRTRTDKPLQGPAVDQIASGMMSEVMVIDWQHEGQPSGFDMSLLRRFPLPRVPLIAFGGLSDTSDVATALGIQNVVAAGVGNFLNYREHAVQAIKNALPGIAIRPPLYSTGLEA